MRENGGRDEIVERLDRIESLLGQLLSRGRVQEWYSTEEFAAIVGKAEFTVREWCRHGRINAGKRRTGRGAHPAWAISHAELERYRREGLLPLSRTRPKLLAA
jgi:hypothetical protein